MKEIIMKKKKLIVTIALALIALAAWQLFGFIGKKSETPKADAQPKQEVCSVISSPDMDFGNIAPNASNVLSAMLSCPEKEKPEFTASISQEGNAFSLVEAPVHTGNTTTIKVNFSPDKTGDFSGKLLIKDKKDNSYEFNLKGKGELEKETKEAAPVVQIEPAPNRKVDEMALQWFKSILSTESIVNIDFGSIKTDALSTLKENDLNSGVIVGTPQFITVKNDNKKPYEVIVINWANNNSDTSIGIESDRNGLFTVINAEETKDVELSLTVFSKLPSGANGYKYDNLYAFILLSSAGTTDKLSKLPDSELEKALKNEIEKNTIKKISYSFAIIP